MKEDVTDGLVSNTSVTNSDNQGVSRKEKIKSFFFSSQLFRKEGFCPTQDLLAVTLDKWSLFIIYNLGYKETLRFSQLRKRINGISPRMLSVTLKRLEEKEVLIRKVYAEVPPKVEYQLTPFGMELCDKLLDMSTWFIHNHPKTSQLLASDCQAMKKETQNH